MRGVEAGLEEQGQVLRKLQDLQLPVPEPSRLEVRISQDGLDLLDREHGNGNVPALFRQEPPQVVVVRPVEVPADDHYVNHRPGAGSARLGQELFDDLERAGAPAGCGGSLHPTDR